MPQGRCAGTRVPATVGPWCCPLRRGGWAPRADLSPHPCCLGRNFDEVISCFADPPSESTLFSEARATVYEEEDAKVGTMPLLSVRAVLGWQWCCWSGLTGWFCCQNIREEPIHILNIALRWAEHVEDEKLVPIFRAFAQSKVCCWGRTPFLHTPQTRAPYPQALPHPHETLPKMLDPVSAT